MVVVGKAKRARDGAHHITRCYGPITIAIRARFVYEMLRDAYSNRARIATVIGP